MCRILNIKSAFAFLTAAVVLCVCFSAPPVKADRDNTHEVELLLVYDESYESFMHYEHNITNYGARVGQIAILGGVPFLYKHNIQLNVTTGPYATYLGTDPAKSCPYLYHAPDPGSGSLFRMIWDYSELCRCSGLTHSQHHSNPSYYTAAANQYATAPGSIYDDVGVVKAHSLCSSNEQPVGGIGRLGDAGLVFDGKSGFVTSETNPEQFFNMLYTKYYFSHELSHNFGAGDGYNNSSHCTANEPCTMNKGFHFIVFASNVWCSRCNNDIDPATFD